MGKGSKRRNEDTQKVNDNWDLIFGKKEKKSEQTETTSKIEEKEPEKQESAETK